MAALCLVAACERSPMPRVSVSGAAAASLEFRDWEQITSLGAVTKYRAKAIRHAGPTPEAVRYALIGTSGERLAEGTIELASAYDYREPLRSGDSFTLSIPAYRGEASGHRVSEIRLELRAKPRPHPQATPAVEIPSGASELDLSDSEAKTPAADTP